MRTTLTLDPDVAEGVEHEMRRTGGGLKATVNNLLRRALQGGRKPSRVPRFQVQPHAFGLKPGFDPDRMNQLVDELEADAAACKLRG